MLRGKHCFSNIDIHAWNVVRDYFPFNFWEHPSQSGHQDKTSLIQVFTFMFYRILLDVLLNVFKLSTLDIMSNPGNDPKMKSK